MLKIKIMKKTKVIMTLGSLVLATAAIVAAKPAKKFTAFSTGNFKNQNVNLGNPTLRILNSAHFTSVFTSGISKTVRLVTAGANSILATLKTGANGTNKLYFH
jgi:hypothetical protein